MRFGFLLAAIAAVCIYISAFFPIRAFGDGVWALTAEEAAVLLESGDCVYARPKENGARLFTDAAADDWLFAVPHTYFAKVTALEGELLRVTYCYEDYDYARAVSGYLSADDVVLTDLAPTGRSFPTVFLSFEGNGAFYKNNRFDSLYSTADVTCESPFFYGPYERGGDRFCYVYCDGRLGYFSEDVFEPLRSTAHPDPMPAQRPQAQDSGDGQSHRTDGFLSTDTRKVVFISVAAIIAVCAVYLIFLPKKRRTDADDAD